MPGIVKQRSDSVTPVIKYDGFTFPPAFRARLIPNPILSPSGRVLLRIEMTLEIECIISGADFDGDGENYASDNLAMLQNWNENSATLTGTPPEIDPALYMLIMRLSKPGKDLYIEGYGFGKFDIQNVPTPIQVTKNTSTKSTSVPDLANGPTPKFINIDQIINASSARVVWQVTFSVNQCLSDGDKLFNGSHGLLGIDYSIDTQIKSNGTFIRTISGTTFTANFVEQVGKKTSFKPDATDASSSIHGIVGILNSLFPLLPDSNREISYSLSERRTELRFTFTDTQIPSDEAYYPGCSAMDVQISARSTTPLEGVDLVLNGKSYNAANAIRCEVSIHGTVEVQKSFPKVVAYNAMILVINEYLLKNPDLKKGGVIVKNFGVTNSIYSRTASFYVNYIFTVPLQDLVTKTLVFTRTPQEQAASDWVLWSKYRSLDQKDYGFEGSGMLQPERRNDAAVDACDLKVDTAFTAGHTKAEIPN